ncbi:YesL family protein [Virgibacillus siamensis]|uniref:YesL family protein n=1 Tax=Virgibacillus siamensis TaxID=480071 RepID=UPI000986DFD6|nr:DUF624 domain-containing protein [Virgibacillus siamensis]
MSQGWKSALERFAEWFSRLAYINMLWIGFTLAGLILFGFVPATVAMFAVVRKWRNNKLHDSVFKTFWGIYRQEFATSNIAGIVMMIIGYILYIDLFVLNLDNSLSMQIVQLLLYIIAGMYLMVVVFFFPVYVHFKMKWYQYIKMGALMIFAAPFQAILMLILGYGIFFLMAKMPILMFFFLGSFISYIWLMIALPTFNKLEKSS